MEKLSKPASAKTTRKKEVWEPYVIDLGMIALKAFLSGFAMKIGGVTFDKIFRSPSGRSLTLIPGGKIKVG